jgi:transcriptional regulator with XRE-family HTH domain
VSQSVEFRFGQRLREIRTGKEISQEDLAATAGLHRTFVSLIERGQRNVTLRTIERLAKALGIKMADLMP